VVWPILVWDFCELDVAQVQAFSGRGHTELQAIPGVQTAAHGPRQKLTPPDVDQCSDDDTHHAIHEAIALDVDGENARFILQRLNVDARDVTNRVLSEVRSPPKSAKVVLAD
jgi:hypothetical protein